MTRGSPLAGLGPSARRMAPARELGPRTLWHSWRRDSSLHHQQAGAPSPRFRQRGGHPGARATALYTPPTAFRASRPPRPRWRPVARLWRPSSRSQSHPDWAPCSPPPPPPSHCALPPRSAACAMEGAGRPTMLPLARRPRPCGSARGCHCVGRPPRCPGAGRRRQRYWQPLLASGVKGRPRGRQHQIMVWGGSSRRGGPAPRGWVDGGVGG